MKKSMILVGMLSIGYATAQTTDYEGRVGINTDEPKATLDVKATNTDKAKGILTPQVSGNDLKTMTGNLTANQHGMISFATSGVTTADDATTNVQFPGFHRFNIAGTEKSWVRLEPSGLEKIKGTGTNIGWRLIGRKPSQYAPIGASAVDLTLVDMGAPETADFGASGNFSFAAGRQTKASAYGTIAMGISSQATKIGAVSIGNNNISSGDYSLALGSDNTSSSWYTTAIGYKNTASVNYGVAMGNTNTASGFAAVAMGTTNTASKRAAVALGESNTASGEHSLALGKGNNTSASFATALGNTNTVSGVASFASGINSTASGYVSYALGNNNIASASYTLAFGSQTKAEKYAAIAMGEDATASGEYSLAIGRGTIASGWGNMALGNYNTETTANNRLLTIGNGINTSASGITRSDAFTVLNDARVGIDIDNFETTTNDAKLQVNGKILANSLAGTGNRPVYADENGVLVIGTATTSSSTGATTLTGDTGLVCNVTNRGKMNFIPSTDNAKSDVFGICMRNKDGNYYWAYMVGGNNPTNGTGAFGSGL